MSCTTALKDELARVNPQKECCAAAELAAAARGMGELSLLGGGRFGLTLSTEHEPTALRMAAQSAYSAFFLMTPPLLTAWASVLFPRLWAAL